MASRVSDWYFTNGNSIDGIRAQVEDIRAKAAANGHSVKVGVNAFIIARDTEEEARAVLDEIIAKADYEAVNAFGDAVRPARPRRSDGNWAKSTFEDLVQYNDGFKTNLIGTATADRRAHRRAEGGRGRPGAVGLPALPRSGISASTCCHWSANWSRPRLAKPPERQRRPPGVGLGGRLG